MVDRKKKVKLFGTDGIRGKANHFPMTGEIAFEVGRAAAYVLGKKHGRNSILIGKDTRLSGYMLESALTSGICSDRKSTRLNSSHIPLSRMPSSA